MVPIKKKKKSACEKVTVNALGTADRFLLEILERKLFNIKLNIRKHSFTHGWVSFSTEGTQIMGGQA